MRYSPLLYPLCLWLIAVFRLICVHLILHCYITLYIWDLEFILHTFINLVTPLSWEIPLSYLFFVTFIILLLLSNDLPLIIYFRLLYFRSQLLYRISVDLFFLELLRWFSSLSFFYDLVFLVDTRTLFLAILLLIIFNLKQKSHPRYKRKNRIIGCDYPIALLPPPLFY
jgi:hypothetical protein